MLGCGALLCGRGCGGNVPRDIMGVLRARRGLCTRPPQMPHEKGTNGHYLGIRGNRCPTSMAFGNLHLFRAALCDVLLHSRGGLRTKPACTAKLLQGPGIVFTTVHYNKSWSSEPYNLQRRRGLAVGPFCLTRDVRTRGSSRVSTNKDPPPSTLVRQVRSDLCTSAWPRSIALPHAERSDRRTPITSTAVAKRSSKAGGS